MKCNYNMKFGRNDSEWATINSKWNEGVSCFGLHTKAILFGRFVRKEIDSTALQNSISYNLN